MHVPKTGGETVIHFLAKEVGGSNILSVHTNEERESFKSQSGSTIKEYDWIVGHLTLWEFEMGIKDMSAWKIFTILRDPYQRFISQYKYLYYSEHPDHKKYKSMDFEEYMKIYKATMRNLVCSMFSRNPTPNNALKEIKKHNVAVYYLEMLGQLGNDLSNLIGSEIKFDQLINKSKSVDVDFEEYRESIEEIVANDMELYQACREMALPRLIDGRGY